MTSHGVGTLVPLRNKIDETKVSTPEVIIIKKDVKHINLKVKPSGEVVLTAPTDCNERDIAYVLKKRAEWIDKKIAFFDAAWRCECRKSISVGRIFMLLRAKLPPER